MTKGSSDSQVFRAAGTLMVISILARLVGLIREQAIAAKFGTERITDIYFLSYSVAQMVYLVLGGALAMVFIPVFATYLIEGKNTRSGAKFLNYPDADTAWVLSSTIINLTLIFMGLVSVVGMLISPWLAQIIAPGYPPEDIALTAQLTRIMFPVTLLLSLNMLAGVILNSLRHFAVPALGSVVFSLTILASVFTLGDRWGIRGLAGATVLAIFLQVLVQLPVLKRKGMRYLPRVHLKHPGTGQMGSLMLPIVFGNTIAQSYIFIERMLTTLLPSGSLSSLNFANRLYMLPFNLFALAINVAIFPTMAVHAAKEDLEALKQTTLTGIKLIGLLTIPSMAWLFVLAKPIVQVVYERGKFGNESTEITTYALTFYLLGLFALGAFNVLNRTFYSLKDTRTPIIISVISSLVNLGAALLLVGPLQHGGLALAAAIAANFNLLVAYLFLRRRLPTITLRELGIPLGKILFASGCMGLGMWFIVQAGALLFGSNPTFYPQLLILAVASVLGVGLYAGLIWWLKPDPELISLLQEQGQKIWRKLRSK